jgi:hypothetical protein
VRENLLDRLNPHATCFLRATVEIAPDEPHSHLLLLLLLTKTFRRAND